MLEIFRSGKGVKIETIPESIIETHPAESRSLDVAVLSHRIADNLKSIRKILKFASNLKSEDVQWKPCYDGFLEIAQMDSH